MSDHGAVAETGSARRSCKLLGALVGLATAVFGWQAPAGARIQHPDYVGHVGASKSLTDHRSKISIRIDGRREHKTVTFEARNVRLFCDDGRRPRFDAGTRSAPLLAGRRFYHTMYSADTQSQDQVLYQFQGRLLPHGRARGFLIQIVDPWDPPGEERPECSTLGKAHWRAARL
jgi:hypothetical protein